MSVPENRDASTSALVRQLSDQTSRLVRQELELLKAELSIKGKQAGAGAGLFGGAGVAALTGKKKVEQALPPVPRPASKREGERAMDQDPRPAGTPMSSGPAGEPEHKRTPDEIRADIDQTRAEVGDTVEALAEKTDVQAQAQHRVDEIKHDVHAKTDEVNAKARNTTPDSAQQLVGTVRANPLPLAAGGALLAAFLLGRRSGRP